MIKVVYNQIELGNIDLPIFAQEKYLRCKSNIYGWFVSDKFVLPFIIDKRYVFKRMLFVNKPIELISGTTVIEEKLFLNDMVSFGQDNNLCDFISMAQAYVVFRTYPDKSEFVDWGTYEVDIDRQNEDILKSFNTTTKKLIRRAIREDVKVVNTDNIELVYETIKQTLVRAHSRFYPSLDNLMKLKQNLKDNVLFLVSSKDVEIQSVLVVVFDNDRATELYGGTSVKPAKGSTQLIKYEGIKLIRGQCKSKIFDLCGARINVTPGSKYEGIQEFKTRFNPTLKQGYGFRVVYMPLKFKLFNFLVKTLGLINGFKYSDQVDQLKSGKY
jgi:lipid II:glycine glycyltransferase (peptidoglycan interpeptide bridge formation enzyme)